MVRIRLTRQSVIRRAQRLLADGRDAENLQLLERAVTRFPEDPEIRLLYATALVPFRPGEAPWQAATAIQLDPDSPSRLTRAASLLFHLGELAPAKSYAARASWLAPDDFKLEAGLSNVVGMIAAVQGDDALAERALREAAESEPQHDVYARDLATFLAERNRTADAISVIDRAIALARDSRKLNALRTKLVSKR